MNGKLFNEVLVRLNAMEKVCRQIKLFHQDPSPLWVHFQWLSKLYSKLEKTMRTLRSHWQNQQIACEWFSGKVPHFWARIMQLQNWQRSFNSNLKILTIPSPVLLFSLAYSIFVQIKVFFRTLNFRCQLKWFNRKKPILDNLLKTKSVSKFSSSKTDNYNGIFRGYTANWRF